MKLSKLSHYIIFTAWMLERTEVQIRIMATLNCQYGEKCLI